MSEKMVFLDVKDTVLRYDAAIMLRQLADNLAHGVVSTDSGDVEIGGELEVECKGKLKPKESGSKGSIKIELSWCASNT